MRQLWGACAVALVACGGGTGTGSDADREIPADGRGTETCRLWQDSICDWAERCEASTRDVCDDQFQGVTCKSDEVASKCADAIDRADCDGIPPHCGPESIADPAPAVHACELIFTRFCDRAVECGLVTSRQACLAVEKPDCSRAFSYTLEHESCLTAIDRVECEALVRPAVCSRVIVTRAAM